MSNTQASVLERLDCSMHSLHKLPFSLIGFLIQGPKTQLCFSFTHLQIEAPNTVFHVHVKQSYRDTKVRVGSRFKECCTYLSYFTHDLAHCPRFQSLLHTVPALEMGQCLQIDKCCLILMSIISHILNSLMLMSQIHRKALNSQFLVISLLPNHPRYHAFCFFSVDRFSVSQHLHFSFFCGTTFAPFHF